MDRGNAEDIDRVLDLLEWSDLNEFKHTSVPAVGVETRAPHSPRAPARCEHGGMTLSARLTRRAKAGSVRASDVVGVPMMPPAGVTAGVERARALVGGAHRALVPPPVRILDAMLAPLDAAVLGAICTLGLPDEIHGAVEVDRLAARVDIDADRLTRIVRYAHSRGWLRLDRRGRVHATRVTRFLSRRHPGGWSGWVEFASNADVLGALAAFARDPRATDPFADANGSAFFAWCSAHPDRQAAFDAAMAAGARMHGLVLVGALDWSNTSRVCDVGGGTGELARVLLRAQPGSKEWWSRSLRSRPGSSRPTVSPCGPPTRSNSRNRTATATSS